MSNEKVDVFVSGAGPVGLFFTYCMAMRGHTVYCVDPKPCPTDQSRAILMTSRTMEVFESQGLAGDILSDAVILWGARTHKDGVPVGQIEACGNTPYAHNTVIMQSKTEEILYNRIIKNTSCKIHWNNELISYAQDDNKVISIVRDIHTGEKRTIESKYIVGADGTHSAVRKGNPDWTYLGSTINTKFALADFHLKGDGLEDVFSKFNLYLSNSNAFGMVRVNATHEQGEKPIIRVFGNLEAFERKAEDSGASTHGLRDKSEGVPPNKKEIQEWMDRMCAPTKYEIDELIWSSYFRVNERIANGFRRKRAFLVGDSAHCHSPAGGQGLNTGLQDAFNLCWKLSDVLSGVSSDPDKLLDSFSNEREPIAKAVIQDTGNTIEAASSASTWFQAVRTITMKVALKFPFIRHFAFTKLMQLHIRIDPETSGIIGSSDKGLIKAGEFLPHCGGLRKSIIPRHEVPNTIQRYYLRDLFIRTNKYTAIFLGTCPSSISPDLSLLKKFWIDTRQLPIRRIVIQSSWHTRQSSFPSWISEDEKEEAKQSFYTEESFDRADSVSYHVGLYSIATSYFAGKKPYSVVLIVRPDLYVAHAKLVQSENELDTALGFFSSMFA